MPTAFEWHEAKRLANVAKHGIDFRDVVHVFAGPHLLAAATTIGGEERRLAIGLLLGRYVVVVYTLRDGALRLISARSARGGERRRHQEVFGVRVEADDGAG